MSPARFWPLAALCLWSGTEAESRQLFAEAASNGLAKSYYMLQCQGCHLHSGKGLAGAVPSLSETLGDFLQVAGGRDYLVRVPGSANAPLTDAQLAMTLNWVLGKFSAASLADDESPYTAEEVASIRQAGALVDTLDARQALLESLAVKR